MKHRPEIDGLRAVAVLPVVLYHAGATGFSGGYVGVDVFFVISGFLISLIIFSELSAGRFSIGSFYERRARRILPALFALILVITPFCWHVMMPHQLKDYAQSLVAVSAFSANVLFWLESGYFEAASELKPLLHTWSLAVEEQFYFFYPLLIIVVWKYFQKALLPVLLTVLIGSFYVAYTLSASSPNANFYLPFSRAWELSVGALCAYYVFKRGLPVVRLANVFAAAGLVAIVLSVVLLDRETPFPGIYAVPCVLGTAAIIMFTSQETAVGRALSRRTLTYVGLISYSLYLWHVSIFAIARLWLNEEPTAIEYIGLTVLSFGAGYLSYRFIETPFRNKKRFGRRFVFSGAALGTIALLSVGYVGHAEDGFVEYQLSRLPSDMASMVVDIHAERRRRNEAWQPFREQGGDAFDDEATTKVLIIGDSVSEDLHVALSLNAPLFPGHSFRRLRLDDGCMSSIAEPASASPACQAEIEALFASPLTASADLIVITATWQQSTVPSVPEVTQALERPGRRILVFGSANFNDVASLSYEIARRRMPREDWGRFFAGNKRVDWNAQNERLRRLLETEPASYISKYSAYCSSADDGEECGLISEDGEPYIYDSGHVTVAGAHYLGRRASELGWLTPP